MAMLAAGTAKAQLPMTLKDCMEYALEQSTEMERLHADHDDARLQRREAILRTFTPDISAGIGVSSNFGRTVDPETNSYINTSSFSNSYSVQGSLLLFDGFAALNNMKIARMAVQMGLTREQQLNDKICLSVMQAYYNVVFHRRMSAVLEAQVASGRAHLTLARRQHELGQKGYADVVQTEADLAEKEYQLVQSGNECGEAMLNLKALMLYPVDDSLAIVEEPSALRQPLPSATDPAADRQLAEWAKQHLPEAVLSRWEMEKAKLELHSVRGSFLPSLLLSGGWSSNYYTYPGKEGYKAPDFRDQIRNNGGEYVQLVLSIPIYSRFSRRTRLEMKKNDCRRAEANHRDRMQRIEAEVSRALQDSRGAFSALEKARKRVKVQEESYRLSERQLEQGLISPLDYQSVSNAFLQAKAEELNAFLQYMLKQSVVSYYKGISYLEQQK